MELLKAIGRMIYNFFFGYVPTEVLVQGAAEERQKRLDDIVENAGTIGGLGKDMFAEMQNLGQRLASTRSNLERAVKALNAAQQKLQLDPENEKLQRDVHHKQAQVNMLGQSVAMLKSGVELTASRYSSLTGKFENAQYAVLFEQSQADMNAVKDMMVLSDEAYKNIALRIVQSQKVIAQVSVPKAEALLERRYKEIKREMNKAEATSEVLDKMIAAKGSGDQYAIAPSQDAQRAIADAYERLKLPAPASSEDEAGSAEQTAQSSG